MILIIAAASFRKMSQVSWNFVNDTLIPGRERGNSFS
jgi:hypothetical protein